MRRFRAWKRRENNSINSCKTQVISGEEQYQSYFASVVRKTVPVQRKDIPDMALGIYGMLQLVARVMRRT